MRNETGIWRILFFFFKGGGKKNNFFMVNFKSEFSGADYEAESKSS